MTAQGDMYTCSSIIAYSTRKTYSLCTRVHRQERRERERKNKGKIFSEIWLGSAGLDHFKDETFSNKN